MQPSDDREGVTLILEGLETYGIKVDSVFDGEDLFAVDTVEEAVEHVFDVDTATVNVVHPDGSESFVWFVLGNPEPCDLVADYGVSLSEYIDPIVDGWS